MLVLAVGEHTQVGNIFNLLSTNNEDDSDPFKFEERPTLQAKVTKLVNQITYAG